MCEICKVKRGCCKPLGESDLDLTIGINKLKSNLVVSCYMDRDEEGRYTLLTGLYDDQYRPFVEMNLSIKFCPFCGEELQHEPNMKYPWDK